MDAHTELRSVPHLVLLEPNPGLPLQLLLGYFASAAHFDEQTFAQQQKSSEQTECATRFVDVDEVGEEGLRQTHVRLILRQNFGLVADRVRDEVGLERAHGPLDLLLRGQVSRVHVPGVLFNLVQGRSFGRIIIEHLVDQVLETVRKHKTCLGLRLAFFPAKTQQKHRKAQCCLSQAEHHHNKAHDEAKHRL